METDPYKRPDNGTPLPDLDIPTFQDGELPLEILTDGTRTTTPELETAPEGAVHEGTVALGAAAKILNESEQARLKAIRRDGRKPKAALENPVPKGGRGHFRKQIRTQLAQSGKLNATPPMSAEQKRLRRRKRKK